MSVAIVGSGFGGLHLALRLQRTGQMVTLYSDRTPEQHLKQLQNTACQSGTTRNVLVIGLIRQTPCTRYGSRSVLPEPVRFEGDVGAPSPGCVIDHRL